LPNPHERSKLNFLQYTIYYTSPKRILRKLPSNHYRRPTVTYNNRSYNTLSPKSAKNCPHDGTHRISKLTANKSENKGAQSTQQVEKKENFLHVLHQN